MTLGEVYGACKPMLYPRGLPDRATQCRDMSIVKRLLKGYTGEQIVAMCQRMRQKVNANDLPEWALPGGNFKMMLVLACQPALLAAEADKVVEHRAPDTSKRPVSIASLLGGYLT